MATEGTPVKKAADWERIELDCKGEAELVRAFMALHATGRCDDRIPHAPQDTVVCEMAFRFGRADIVIFHLDGSASVIEAKDGANGYNHVVSGIGQAGLYAAQLSMLRVNLRRVHRCLLWSSTGNLALDLLIEQTCEAAGVVALPFQSVRSLRQARAEAMALVQRIAA